MPFARDDRLGWLTFCPTNLGSTVRASVHIKLPKLSARKDFKASDLVVFMFWLTMHQDQQSNENFFEVKLFS